MFGLGFPEILLILLLAVLVMGPEHMPRAARQIGRWSAKMRSAATSFGNAVAGDEDLRELKENISQVRQEIDIARQEILSPKTEIESLSEETRDAYESARREFMSPASGEPEEKPGVRAGADAPAKGGDAPGAAEARTGRGAVSPYMSRPAFRHEDDVPADAGKPDGRADHGNYAVTLAKARFLPEAVSRRVTKRRVLLDDARPHAGHRAAGLRPPSDHRVFARIRALSAPRGADGRAMRRVVLAKPAR